MVMHTQRLQSVATPGSDKKINSKNMAKQFYKDAFLWGFVLWLIGYLLGIILFVVVPADMIGWVIMPIGIIITVWVLLKKTKGDSFMYYILLGGVWALIAILLDFFLLVKVFNPAGGYYKLDVYIYYALTFALPVIVGCRRFKKKK